MNPIRIGERLVAPGEGLAALARERDRYETDGSKERFSPDICQCCGAVERPGETCVCDGLDWYMIPGTNGAVECQAHRFARAIGANKKQWMIGK